MQVFNDIRKLFSTSIFILVSTSLANSHLDKEDGVEGLGYDVCYSEAAPTKLELVFSVQIAGKPAIDNIPEIIKISDQLLTTYPGSKFGITLTGDFECTSWSLPRHCATTNKDEHKDPNGCYRFWKELTTDLNALKEAVQPGKVPFLFSYKDQASVNGLYLTASESKLGWTPVDADPELTRIIIVITDAGTYNREAPNATCVAGGKRGPIKENPVNPCCTQVAATDGLTGRVLKKRDIAVFVLKYPNDSYQEAGNTWDNVLKQMRIKYRMVTGKHSNNELLTKLKEFIKEIQGKPKLQKCGDPPAFNTLGL